MLILYAHFDGYPDIWSNAICRCIYMVILHLLMLSNDIERNPGPCKKSLAIYHLNICSLLPKLDDVAIEFQDFDVVCFSETHLDDSITNDHISIPGYQEPERKDRNRHGGGIAVYVKNTLAYRRIPNFESDSIESILCRNPEPACKDNL